jgi:hypothetical protein
MNLQKKIAFSLSLLASASAWFITISNESASALTFNFSGYASGTTTQNFAVPGGSDIQVSYGAGGAAFTSSNTTGVLTPDDNVAQFGASTANKLFLSEDLPAGLGTTNIFTAPAANKNIINFLFNPAGASTIPELVRLVSFNLLDVDRDINASNNFQDFVGVRGCIGAITAANCTILPTLTGVNSGFTTINNLDATAIGNSTNVLNTSTNANVFVDFGNTQINGFQVFYGSGTSLAAGNTDSSVQTIAISPISFEAVPFEFEQSLVVLAIGGFWAMRKWQSRRKSD